jgi:hypothetical protein
MQERQRPGAFGLAIAGGAVAVGLCLLALASASARASEPSAAPEPSPQTAGEGEAPANVKPDPAPQAAEGTSHSPGQSTRSPNPSSGPSPAAAEANQPLVTYASPREESPAARSVGAAPVATRAPAVRRSHARHRLKRARPAHATVHGRHHTLAPVTGATALAPASGHSQGLLLLFASLASAVLMFASLTLLRLLRRLGGTVSMGSGP